MIDIFGQEQFVKAAVFFQDKRVVKAGYEQDFVDPMAHEILESLEAPDMAPFGELFFEIVHLHVRIALSCLLFRPKTG